MKTLSALIVLVASALATSASAADSYRLLQTIPVPGDDGWDHPTIDAAARRLYVSHGTHVVVIDVDSGKLVGKIDKTPGVHVIALDPESGRGFISNGGAASLTIGTIDLGGRPELAATDAKGHVFVNLVEKNAVLQIDSRKMAAGESWPLGSCERPGTMAIDRNAGRLFVGCANGVMVVLDANNGRQITTVPIGLGRDDAAYDPQTRRIYSSNGEGTVTVIQQESPDKYGVLETIKTAPGARSMALDPKTHKIFLPLFDRGPPPPATEQNPNPRGNVIPGSFRVLVFGM